MDDEKKDERKIKTKITIGEEYLAELSREYELLKKEFRVSEEKLRVPTDEEIVFRIRVRYASIKPRKLYVYLAGPIELEEDFGTTWREKCLAYFSKRSKRDIIPLDPGILESYKVGTSPGDSLRQIGELRRRRDFLGYRQMAGKIRIIDTNLIRHKTCFIIMHIPQGKATGGTSSENQIALIEKIPVFLVCEGKALDDFSSTWVLDGILANGRIFGSFEDLFNFLDQIIPEILEDGEI